MKLLVFMSLFLINVGYCFADQTEHPTEHKTIKSVIDAFKQSIQTKDKNRFLNLFLDPTKPMIAVVSEQGLEYRRALVEKINKEQNKKLVATRTFTLTPIEAIDSNVSRTVNSKEEFSNLRIDSDGNIASIYFDYVYYIGDKRNNWGKESWQLVQTLKGWKISSVVYSVISQ